VNGPTPLNTSTTARTADGSASILLRCSPSASLVPLSAMEASMNIKIIPNDRNTPAGKLADAELHFTSGPLDGLKLIGFGVWERQEA
jgi:hypothetical protein